MWLRIKFKQPLQENNGYLDNESQWVIIIIKVSIGL